MFNIPMSQVCSFGKDATGVRFCDKLGCGGGAICVGYSTKGV